MPKGYERFFAQYKEEDSVVSVTLQMFGQLVSTPLDEHDTVLSHYRTVLSEIRENPFEKRSFLYLDIIPWITSAIERKTVEEVVRADRS